MPAYLCSQNRIILRTQKRQDTRGKRVKKINQEAAKHEKTVEEKRRKRRTDEIPLLSTEGNRLTSDDQGDIPHRKEERKSTAPSSPETELKRKGEKQKRRKDKNL